MDVANLTSSMLVDHGRIADPARPVLTMSYEMGPSRTPPHQHPRAHLFYCTRGVFQLVTGEATWVVPPTQGVWVPSRVVHSVTSTQPIALLSLFIDASATAGLPDQCLVVDVPSLMRELILRAIAIGNDYPAQGPATHLMRVILDELQQLKAAPLCLPKAKDKRLQKITETYLGNPADERNLEDWAPTVGASVRTIERQFVAETGMTFAEWRRQVRLLEAIDRLGKGHPVTRVALDLGYQSPSAFIAMFRRTLGVSPGHYFQNTKD